MYQLLPQKEVVFPQVLQLREVVVLTIVLMEPNEVIAWRR